MQGAVHFDSPANGHYRVPTGDTTYNVSGDFTIDGSQNKDIEVRVTKSTDGGIAFSTAINSLTRTINSLVGSRDVAFFPVNFMSFLKSGDILRIEVKNKTDTSNVTQEIGGYLIVTEV